MANTTDRLTALAEAAGLSESALAERAGIALSTLRRRRRRLTDLTVGEILGLSDALGIEPDALFPALMGDAPNHPATSAPTKAASR